MKKIKFVIISLIVLLFSSCDFRINGVGDVVVDSYTIKTSVTKIMISNTMHLVLKEDVKPGTLEIQSNENILDYIIVRDLGSNGVEIDLENKNFGDLDIVIYASSQQFSQVIATGASCIENIDKNVVFENYSIELSGASAYFGYLNVDKELYLAASSVCYIEPVGYCNKCVVDMSGATEINGEDFEVNYLDVNMSGASSIDTYVNRSIYGYMSGSSIIRYRGGRGVTIDVNMSGSSAVLEY